MKLVYIVNARIPTEKAHGYQITKMCEEFASAGAEVELWAPTRQNPIKENAFEYYGLKRNYEIKYIKSFDFIRFDKFLLRKSVYLQSLFFLLKLALKRVDKDAIIYTRNPELVWLFGLRGIRVVYDAHSWPESKTGILKLLLHSVDAIICNSRGTEKKFQENGFKNTLSAPNGVDLHDFEDQPGTVKLRNELGLPLDKKIAMYVGHLYEWKGIDVLLDCAELMKVKKDLFFAVIGGTEKDIKKYRKIIEDKKLKNIVFFGFKNKKIIPQYLQSADIMLLPNVPVSAESSEYTSPIKLFEYMASGRPIVASNLPSIREVLDEETAFFCQPGNAEDLNKKITQVLNDLVNAHLKADAAREKVREYTWEKRAGRILKFVNAK